MEALDEGQHMPADGARLIQEALAKLGWPSNPTEVADEVRRLDIGLPLEDEFSVICAWLGKCHLLHKLDQQQVPISSRQEFQVPDLLAKFSTQNTKSPLLIEVKSKKDKRLSFTPDYMRRLQNYADLVGMPLLIAWKFHSFWTLFEAKHMKKATKNFNITLDTAAQENLLGMLAGDVGYMIGPTAGVHLRFRKDKLVETDETEGGRTEQWSGVIDTVTFTDYEGNHRTDLTSEVQSLFTAWDLETKEVHTDTHIQLRFVAGNEGMQFAHSSLVRLLNWESPNDTRPHWRGLLRKDQVTASISNFSAALQLAYRQKVVSHIFYLEPHTRPAFLPTR
ncbi:restriction endonuclease [Massilia pseudoviolaceinigra]|uniref:restriction endonuclease n=1 Tax=Massilia pseudoviolaceinigra TaxID=3057165 RepID=UPI00279679F0|nr:restriction endonuclease [Massilia sp. CCM 9206]MDQ1920125.1 restriction endonuclease [Massilia sp. CCM 9206]